MTRNERKASGTVYIEYKADLIPASQSGNSEQRIVGIRTRADSWSDNMPALISVYRVVTELVQCSIVACIDDHREHLS